MARPGGHAGPAGGAADGPGRGLAGAAGLGPPTPDGTPFAYYVFRESPPRAPLAQVLANWDGQWYERIATIGYPRASDVASANDAWASAFPPGFPLVARGLTAVTGLSFGWAALLLDTVAVLVAVALMFSLVRAATGSERVAAAAAVGLSLLPGSPVLGVAYSEALALALVLAALRLTVTRHYVGAAVALLALAFTRPIAVAFLAVIAAHALLRLRAQGWRMGLRDAAGMGLVALVAAASPWLWPTLAAALYGVPDLTRFVGSSRTDHITSSLGSGYLGVALAGGALLLVPFLVGVALLLGGPALVALRRRFPPEVVVWGVAYTGMVLVVTPITPGLLRYLVLAGPLYAVLFTVPVDTRRPALRRALLGGLVVVMLLAQWAWLRYLFVLDPAPAVFPWAP